MAPALDADATVAWGVAGSSALSTQGALYYQTQSEGATHGYDVLRRLSDDTALAVIRTPARCVGVSSTAASPFVFGFLNYDANVRWMGYYSPAAGTFVPPPSPFADGAIMDSAFSWNGGLGFLDLGGVAEVLVTPQPQLQRIFVPTGSATQGRAQPSAGLVAWLDSSTFPTTVRGWTQDGGVTGLFQGMNFVVAFGIGDQNIAFLDVTGAMVQSGIYETARIYWTPTATSPGGIHVTAGIDISGQVIGNIQTLSTAGDYIAVPRQVPTGPYQQAFGILATQISTGKLWVLLSRPNMVMTLAGMSATEILAFESDYSFSKTWGDRYFQRWLRLDLTKLDQLVTTLPAGM
jgi:hypothetical protein